MKLSCIVPNYNHAPYLGARINSILGQTHRPDEIILLDDSSTDGSHEILMRYAKNFPNLIKYYPNTENSGSPFAQWKKGLQIAQGDYVWIAESDDVAESEFAEQLLGYIEKNKSDVGFCRSFQIDHADNKVGHFDWIDESNTTAFESNFTMDSSQFLQEYLRHRNVIPNTSALILRRNIVNLDDIPTDFKMAGDWLFYIHICNTETGKLSYISTPLNHFRRHGMSTNVTKDRAGERRRYKEYFVCIEEAAKQCNTTIDWARLEWISDEWARKVWKKSISIEHIFPPAPASFLWHFKFKSLLLLKRMAYFQSKSSLKRLKRTLRSS